MIRHYVLAGAAAAALLITVAPLQRANAVPLPQTGIEKSNGVELVRRGGRRGFRGFRGMRPRGFRRPHVGRRFRPRPHFRVRPRSFYYYGGGYLPYAYYPSYDDSYYDDGACAGLRRKAQRTGSRYWWKRYRRCIQRYD